uniref:Uncharacterized protein n=1 Tax=Globisporangium ultimum (strain ATCC 200006 / CBS 805.95 / DAOM BR144) TaxID=431595 RepID=K3WPM3_GLOUD
MGIAQYVALCTRLSRFVQLQTLADDDVKAICSTCSDLTAFYRREEEQQQQPPTLGSIHSVFGASGPSSATMDDIVLLTMQKLLQGVVMVSDNSVKESVFQVCALVLARSAEKIRAFNGARLLGFLQSCVLYLPTPDAAREKTTADNEDGGKSAAVTSLQSQSEELRLHVLTCMLLLLSGKAEDVRLAAATTATEQIHFFAYVVSSLLHIAQHDKCRPVAKLAVDNVALVMAFIHDSTLLRQFFPGISLGMWKTINAPQQASKVAVAALQCLSMSIKLCINDEFNANARNATSFSIDALRALQNNHGNRDQVKAASELQEERKDSWLEETVVNVDIILAKLFGAQMLYQKSWRVRHAMTELCGTVVLCSRYTLHDSFFRCYEELLVFRVDAITEVAASAQDVIKQLQTELSTDEWLRMVPMLADRFQMHLSTLALKSGTELESVSVTLMRKLIGYVSFLGPRLGAYLDASMDATYSGLCRILEFDAIDIELILHQKYKADPLSEDGAEDKKHSASPLITSQFQKRLRFFHEEESVKVASQLLEAIGSVCTPALFVDCAFTLLHNNEHEVDSSRRAEIVLVLNGLLKAYVSQTEDVSTDVNKPLAGDSLLEQLPSDESRGKRDSGVDVHLVGRILEDLLLLNAWNEHNDAKYNARGTQLKQKKANVSQRALLVECVGLCVEIIQRDFAVFLLDTLYPLVEKLGSQDVEVEQAALATLNKIYYFCGYASMEALFEANMDYFVDALCSRLEHLHEFPLTASVVEGLLRHTKIASLPLVDEVANSLLRSVDTFQDSPYISSLLRALKLLLSSMTQDTARQQTVRQVLVRDTIPAEPAREKPGAQLQQFITEMCILTNEKYDTTDESSDVVDNGDGAKEDARPRTEQEIMKGAMPIEFDERDPTASDQDDEHDKSSEGTSTYTPLIIEILDRSGHFLSESDPIACCLVLSIIDEGVLLLRDARKELLPLIHRIWSAIRNRLAVQNKPIVTATFKLLNTLAVVAGDFIGDRFVEHVWPALRSHLSAMELKANAPQLTRSMLLISDKDSTQNSLENASESETTVRTRKTHDTQLLLAAMECLVTVCRRSSAVTLIVPEVTATCGKFLSAALPSDVVTATKTLFEALAELNGDEVFCALAPLAQWVPPSPPSARFPAFSNDATQVFYQKMQVGRTRDANLYREHAVMLMRQLQRKH